MYVYIDAETLETYLIDVQSLPPMCVCMCMKM